MTVTDTTTATVTDTAALPSVAETIAAVRAGRIEPQQAHPTTSPWTPVVYLLGGGAAAAGIVAVIAYWRGHDQISDWSAVAGLFLVLLALLALRREAV